MYINPTLKSKNYNNLWVVTRFSDIKLYYIFSFGDDNRDVGLVLAHYSTMLGTPFIYSYEIFDSSADCV